MSSIRVPELSTLFVSYICVSGSFAPPFFLGYLLVPGLSALFSTSTSGVHMPRLFALSASGLLIPESFVFLYSFSHLLVPGLSIPTSSDYSFMPGSSTLAMFKMHMPELFPPKLSPFFPLYLALQTSMPIPGKQRLG